MSKTISQLTSQGAGSRSKDDLFEIENASSASRKQTRQNGITILESPLIELNSTNRDISTTPIELVAAPGNALQMLVPAYLVFYLDAGGTAFDFNASGIGVAYSTATGTFMQTVAQALINNASDQYRIYDLTSGNPFVFNDSLVLTAAAAPTQGNGTAYFRLLYSLQDMNP